MGIGFKLFINLTRFAVFLKNFLSKFLWQINKCLIDDSRLANSYQFCLWSISFGRGKTISFS